MKLSYGENANPESLIAAILEKDQYRAELHIKRRDEHTYLLVCVAGASGASPEKQKVQGPFHSYDQASGSANAIAQALINCGFKLILAVPVWQLKAQAIANDCRDAINKNAGEYAFDPKDVL